MARTYVGTCHHRPHEYTWARGGCARGCRSVRVAGRRRISGCDCWYWSANYRQHTISEQRGVADYVGVDIHHLAVTSDRRGRRELPVDGEGAGGEHAQPYLGH